MQPEAYTDAWQEAVQRHYRVYNVNGRKCPAGCPVCEQSLKSRAGKRGSRYITFSSGLDELPETRGNPDV
jgi:hypothetical protein